MESLRLATALGSQGNVHPVLLRAFDHVRPNLPKLSLDTFFRVYVPECPEMFW